MILACNCHHEYQDEQYGPKQRVHNRSKNGWRCTVCTREKLVNNAS